MDIIRFNNPTAPTKMEQGEVVNGLQTKMWIERYREAGEFTLTARADSGIRERLPVGSFISHVNTAELMMVENHEISDNNPNAEPIITVTGSGFESYLDNRIVGSNRDFPFSGVTSNDYYLGFNYSWLQAIAMINEHIQAANLLDDNNALPYVTVVNGIVGTPGVIASRSVKVGGLYTQLVDLLTVDNLGIQILRPGPSTPAGVPAGNLAIVLHKGVDRSAQVIFSYDTDEITSADYLWSNKKFKNGAVVQGKWVMTVVLPGETGLARRMMFVEANDIDQDLTAAPTGTALTSIVNAMQQRGLEALLAQREIALSKPEVSKKGTKAIFRVDYNVGDLVRVRGDYNESSVSRVTEYVEIEDENGESGSPTLAMD